MVTSTRTTLEQFLALPDIEERRLELIDGEVYEKPMPRWGHGSLAIVLGAKLNEVGFAAAEARALIPSSADMDASAPLPDVAFYRENPPASDEWMTLPPDVAVEILSRGQNRREMRAKIQAYVTFGVRSVWVVDIERQSIDVYEGGARRTLGRGDTLSSPHAPGFAMTLDEVFGSRGK
ncbi:MAG: Uma2 family endonuclease [Tepidiformaceae bacterium]